MLQPGGSEVQAVDLAEGLGHGLVHSPPLLRLQARQGGVLEHPARAVLRQVEWADQDTARRKKKAKAKGYELLRLLKQVRYTWFAGLSLNLRW